jgi:hypothetical protein
LKIIYLLISFLSLTVILFLFKNIKNKYYDMLLIIYFTFFFSYHYFFSLKFIIFNNEYILNYLIMKLIFFIFFISPFIYIFRLNKTNYKIKYTVEINSKISSSLFLLFVIILVYFFINISYNYQLFFRRLGH